MEDTTHIARIQATKQIVSNGSSDSNDPRESSATIKSTRSILEKSGKLLSVTILLRCKSPDATFPAEDKQLVRFASRKHCRQTIHCFLCSKVHFIRRLCHPSQAFRMYQRKQVYKHLRSKTPTDSTFFFFTSARAPSKLES